jgi:PD-(D/E)XK nuclease superfamily protein
VSNTRLPQIVRLTPSSYADFLWCRRLYLTRTLLRVPESDEGRSPDQGQLVHDVLERVHATGHCSDQDHVRTVLAEVEADTDQMHAFIARHARRCPADVEKAVHEVDRVRFHREPAPMFLASARIDVVWIHDGVLDVRDYKTGKLHYEHLADDPRARMQAWIMARDARRTGLRLQLRYEYLQPDVGDDPIPWEPGDDDLAVIEEELRATVAEMRREEAWNGVADAEVCRTCRYRSICRDSAAVGEPAWPALSANADAR